MNAGTIAILMTWRMTMATEIEPLDRLTDLVTELLDEYGDPRAVRNTVETAIEDWKLERILAKRDYDDDGG